MQSVIVLVNDHDKVNQIGHSDYLPFGRSGEAPELAIIDDLVTKVTKSFSRSECEAKSHHRGLMKTSNFRREIR